jgi:hypothetical protein
MTVEYLIDPDGAELHNWGRVPCASDFRIDQGNGCPMLAPGCRLNPPKRLRRKRGTTCSMRNHSGIPGGCNSYQSRLCGKVASSRKTAAFRLTPFT